MLKLFSYNTHSSLVLLIYNFKEVTPLGFLPESPFHEVNGNSANTRHGVQYMHTVYTVQVNVGVAITDYYFSLFNMHSIPEKCLLSDINVI